MTFTRTPRTPTNFMAYKNNSESLVGEGLHIQIQGFSVDLSVEDAQALAEYIDGHFPRETSE